LQAAPDGIILLGGGSIYGLEKVSVLSQNYPKARLIFSGVSATTSADDLPLKLLPYSAATRRAFTLSPGHGRLSRTHFMPPHCSTQSLVKGGC